MNTQNESKPQTSKATKINKEAKNEPKPRTIKDPKKINKEANNEPQPHAIKATKKINSEANNEPKPQTTKATQKTNTVAQNQPKSQTANRKFILINNDGMDNDNHNAMSMIGASVRSCSATSLLVWYIVERWTVNFGVRPIPYEEELKLLKLLGALFGGTNSLVGRLANETTPRQELQALCGQHALPILLRAPFKHKKWIEEILNMEGMVSSLRRELQDDPDFSDLHPKKGAHDEEAKVCSR